MNKLINLVVKITCINTILTYTCDRDHDTQTFF